MVDSLLGKSLCCASCIVCVRVVCGVHGHAAWLQVPGCHYTACLVHRFGIQNILS